MIKAIKEKLYNLIKRQDGMALPAVLAMFAIGSLFIVPSISYVATNLKAGVLATEEFEGILTADAGVEDALWKIINDDPDFLEPYTITDINGLSIDIDIDEIDTLAGEPVGDTGQHPDRLSANTTVTYDSGTYFYTLALTSHHNKPIKIDSILIDFPAGVDYVIGSTSSNITKPPDADPTTVGGSPTTGIILVWVNDEPQPSIPSWGTEYHSFELSGPPGIEDIEGHGVVEAHSDDIGTIWLSDIKPYTITAEAKDSSGEVIAAIKAGVWGGSGSLEISCWQVIP